MAYFVKLEPESKIDKQQILDSSTIVIRQAELADCSVMAQIVADREGTDENYNRIFSHWEPKLKNKDQTVNQIFVAMLTDKTKDSSKIVGFANVEFVDLTGKTDETTGLAFTAPSGWYLLGLTVHSDYRRLGIGSLLTQARIDWALNHDAKAIRYYTNPQNLTSMAFHAELGFSRIEKELTFPNRPVYKTVLFEKVLI